MSGGEKKLPAPGEAEKNKAITKKKVRKVHKHGRDRSEDAFVDKPTLKIDYVRLRTGAIFPLIGYGIHKQSVEEDLEVAVWAALDVGYPLFDVAFGQEHFFGGVLHDFFRCRMRKREDFFITAKLPCFAHRPSDVYNTITGQLKDLQLEYVDLYLIHVPCPCKIDGAGPSGKRQPLLIDGKCVPDLVPIADTWKAMEKVFRQGKAKAIGVCNFNISQLQKLLDSCEIRPHNVQVECHLYWPQRELHEFCKKNGITFSAYGPLGLPSHSVEDPACRSAEAQPLKNAVACGFAEKYNKTPAQVLLRHLLQRGISAISKTISVNRIHENLDILDFALTDDEKHKLDNVSTRFRQFRLEQWSNHPWYPLMDVDVSKLKPDRRS